MRCAVETCPEDAFHLLNLLERFGDEQPHYGVWYGIWLCETHVEELMEKLNGMGIYVDEQRMPSGLPPIPKKE